MVTRMVMARNYKRRADNPRKRGMYMPLCTARAPHVQPRVHGMYNGARAVVHVRPPCGEKIIVSTFDYIVYAVKIAFCAPEAPDYVTRDFS